MDKSLIVIAAIILLGLWLAAGNDFSRDFCGTSTMTPCDSGADCVTDGCSGEVCRAVADGGMMTTCDYKECYDSTGYTCGCFDGQCRWKATG